MENIKAILSKFSEQLTEEQREEIASAVNENYRTIDELSKKKKRIDELEKLNGELSESIGKLEADGEEIEALRDKVAKFESDEAERKASEQEAAKRDSFRTVFDAAVNGREFANDLIRETVFEKVYSRCAIESGLGAKEALDAVTKDCNGIWTNPQQPAKPLPGASDMNGGKPAKGEEKAKQEIKAFLFPDRRKE